MSTATESTASQGATPARRFIAHAKHDAVVPVPFDPGYILVDGAITGNASVIVGRSKSIIGLPGSCKPARGMEIGRVGWPVPLTSTCLSSHWHRILHQTG